MSLQKRVIWILQHIGDAMHSRSLYRYSRAVNSQNSHKVISSTLWDTVLQLSVWEGQTLPSCFLFRTNLLLLIKIPTVLVHRSFRSNPKSSVCSSLPFCYMNIFCGDSTNRLIVDRYWLFSLEVFHTSFLSYVSWRAQKDLIWSPVQIRSS